MFVCLGEAAGSEGYRRSSYFYYILQDEGKNRICLKQSEKKSKNEDLRLQRDGAQQHGHWTMDLIKKLDEPLTIVADYVLTSLHRDMWFKVHAMYRHKLLTN